MKKFVASIVFLFLVLALVCVCIGLSFEYPRVDNVYINEVVQGLDINQPPQEIIYDYTYFDKDGGVIYSSAEVEEMSYDARISRAIANGDVLVDHNECKVVFYTKSSQRFADMQNTILIFIAVSFGIMAIAIGISIMLLYRRTIRPFEKLKTFSGEVAKGNLDFPLKLDKYNSFGAFGEAFDIMRNNLKESRLAEQRASVEKRRLMQEIGHDIKTPLASIKAVAECGYATDNNQDYAIILDKANTIDNLVNDFYHASLEDEGQLGIYIMRHSSSELATLIASCDYNKRANISLQCDCFTLYDNIRLTQVFENIIANSYKYADTDIDVTIKEQDGKVEVSVRDYGKGVNPEELSYIMDRFYRGEKTQEKLGQGLGLHICRKLVARMGGEMTCRNEDGFVVEINLQKYELERNS